MHHCLENIDIEGSFPPFVFCPYCGEKLADNIVKDENLQAKDEEAFARLDALEDILEEKFDDIVVKDVDTLYAMVEKEMNALEMIFPMSKEEEKIEISHKGHYETRTIELFLELEDEDSTLYTVSVF